MKDQENSTYKGGRVAHDKEFMKKMSKKVEISELAKMDDLDKLYKTPNHNGFEGKN